MKTRALLSLARGAAERPIVFSFALAAGDASEDDAPKWCQAARAGTFEGHGYGGFTFDAIAFMQMARNLQRHPAFKRGPDGYGCADVIPIDFHHANEAPPFAVAQLGAPAQGWVQDLEMRGEKGKEQLWALIRWLEPARTYVREGRYKWLSVAVWPNTPDPVTNENLGWYCSSIALTNDPFIQGMEPVAASRRAAGEQQDGAGTTPAERQQIDMSFLARIAERLGVPSPVILGARDNDPKGMAALEHALEKAVETQALQLDGARSELSSVLEAIGSKTIADAAPKLVALTKKAKDWDDAADELVALRKDRAAKAEAEIDQDVTAVLDLFRLPAELKPSLMLHRKSDPAGFAAAYPKPPAGYGHLMQAVVTPAPNAPARGYGLSMPHAPAAAPRQLGTGGREPSIDLSRYPGANDVVRAMEFIKAERGGKGLSYEKLHAQACDLVLSLRAGN